MRNLLTIETNLLQNQVFRSHVSLDEVNAIQSRILNGQKSKLANSLALASLVKQGAEWFKSEESQALLREEGISWTMEDFFYKVYGWQKSFGYKMVKAGSLDGSIVDTFNRKCTQVEHEGEQADRTIEGLLKYAKSLSAPASTGTDGEEGENNGEEDSDSAGVARVETLVTFTSKPCVENRATKAISFRILADGTVKTTNTKTEIRDELSRIYAVIGSTLQS
jgi:hypothetical protein